MREWAMKSVRGLLFGALLAFAGCVPKPAEPPKPPPRRPVAVAPLPPPPMPTPPPPEWSDIPLTPGQWSYRDGVSGSEAVFGSPAIGSAFIVRCDKPSRIVTFVRQGVTTGNTMTVRTSSSRRNLPLSVETNGALPFSPLTASDPFLDDLVFSRGRITVEVPGTPILVIPTWPEPGRVVEDCRG
jgi:hypothetical protein